MKPHNNVQSSPPGVLVPRLDLRLEPYALAAVHRVACYCMTVEQSRVYDRGIAQGSKKAGIARVLVSLQYSPGWISDYSMG